ncbi:GDS1 [Candida metapsilosis]|uniref:GDS1 n=1 Tax=Candida metapsilosis TaxID=273372 RepID=A0A8H8DCA7_9ASCO|nr:GDS1 [Candida metapsilosis]
MALTDRRPVSLSTNTPVSSSPTFNPNTLGISSRKTKNRKNSLPLHPTEKQEVKEEENNEDTKEINSQDANEDDEDEDEDMDQHLEQDSDDKHSLSLHDGDDFDHDRDLDPKDGDDNDNEDDDDDDKHSIASDLGKMGLANDSETLSTSRSTSPDSMLGKNKSHTRESTPPTTTSTPSSSQNDSAEKATSATVTATATVPTTGTGTGTKKVKKAKPISRAPIATGISTAIPVTGEKPKPIQEGDASLEDDVLYAIFVILYERDPDGHGFTVKQICDVLTEEHPQIASLSTKTSNLVSAKLNAYVKRVEKGDTNLKYAISRDWADASPKRMVYVYRGLLAPGFEVVAKKLTDELKQQRNEEKAHAEHNNNKDHVDAAADADDADVNVNVAETAKSVSTATSPKSGKKHHQAKDALPVYIDDSLEAGKQATLAKPRRQTMFDLGVTKNSFFETGSGGGFDKTNLFVPYASAPVTAALSKVSKRRSSDMMDLDIGANTYGDADAGADADNDADEDDDDDDDVFANVFADSDDDEIDNDYAMIETMRKNGKRSKSMSYLSMTKKTKVLTAAAAAPRASRAPSSHSPNAAAAAAALHAAALRAIARSSANATTTTTTNKANGSSCSEESAAASASTASASTCAPGSLCSNKKWLSVIRSGFLSQDIGAPEDTSLSDIEKFFA